MDFSNLHSLESENLIYLQVSMNMENPILFIFLNTSHDFKKKIRMMITYPITMSYQKSIRYIISLTIPYQKSLIYIISLS